MQNINDSEKLAKTLLGLVKPIKAKINLIPYNTVFGLSYKTSSDDKILKFWKTLNDGGVLTTIRKNRGEDILAACGQLSGVIKKRNPTFSPNV